MINPEADVVTNYSDSQPITGTQYDYRAEWMRQGLPVMRSGYGSNAPRTEPRCVIVMLPSYLPSYCFPNPIGKS